MSDIRTRMAPSPTGNLHIGTAYATMWSYIFARHSDGVFILRFEDTDQERSTKDFEKNIEEGLKWLTFSWDEGPFHQMDRLDIYKKYTDQLLSEGKAYLCFCTKEELEAEKKQQTEEKKPIVYSGKCRDLSKEEMDKYLEDGKSYVVRFKMPENRGVITYEDMIHGTVSTESSLIGDTVIMRANGVPLYNFAVVVDDIEMKITDIIRGDDHISNTPKQVVLYEAFDYPLPKFAHAPVILNQDRDGKLSKRTGSTSVDSFRQDGYLPEAMFNYIALLGWAPKNGEEIFNKDQIIRDFDIKNMHRSAAAWNQDKLDWMNGEYIRAMSDEELSDRLIAFLPDYDDTELIRKLTPLVKERIKKLSDFIPICDWIFSGTEYELSDFENLKIPGLETGVLTQVKETFDSFETPWQVSEFEEKFKALAVKLGISNFQMFQLVRLMVAGQLITPPLFETMQIMGEEEAMKRINFVVEKYPNLPIISPN